MALRIVEIPSNKYEPIQLNGTWADEAMYICKKQNGSAEIYIHGRNCGSFYDDSDVQNKILELQNEYSDIQYLSNLELEELLK